MPLLLRRAPVLSDQDPTLVNLTSVKVLSPNTVTPGVGASTYEFRGGLNSVQGTNKVEMSFWSRVSDSFGLFFLVL